MSEHDYNSGYQIEHLVDFTKQAEGDLVLSLCVRRCLPWKDCNIPTSARFIVGRMTSPAYFEPEATTGLADQLYPRRTARLNAKITHGDELVDYSETSIICPADDVTAAGMHVPNPILPYDEMFVDWHAMKTAERYEISVPGKTAIDQFLQDIYAEGGGQLTQIASLGVLAVNYLSRTVPG